MSRRPHRYIVPAQASPVAGHDGSRTRTLERSAAILSGMQAFQPLTAVAIREIIPRLGRGEQRIALMEDLAADPVGALRGILTRMKVGPSLEKLIRAAIHAENIEADRWSIRR